MTPGTERLRKSSKRVQPSLLEVSEVRTQVAYTQLVVPSDKFPKLTHYLFRFPAKFHPPLVKSLLERYTKTNDLVFDPFCGSGTLLVEASVAGRRSFGIDVDPLAVLISNAKVTRHRQSLLVSNAHCLIESLHQMRRSDAEYQRRMHRDLSEGLYEKQIAPVRDYVPEIPNLFHWFRRYVIVDLAYIRRAIDELQCSDKQKRFFLIVFASIIRNASNADPVAVSGLEYTAHMRRRDDAGRLVDPFALFDASLSRALNSIEAFGKTTKSNINSVAYLGDATQLSSFSFELADAVITSPPYHGAVDYYRRHQLEHFWLGLTDTQDERLELLGQYVGRPKVPQRDRFVVDGVLATGLVKYWEAKIREVSNERADAFKHYLVAMQETFAGLSGSVKRGAPVLMVVGHSSWNGSQIPTTDLFAEIAQEDFTLEEVLWYPVTNRYMSYSRHNGANIETEYVLVLRRRL